MGESSSRETGENEESSGRRAPSEGTIDESVLTDTTPRDFYGNLDRQNSGR